MVKSFERVVMDWMEWLTVNRSQRQVRGIRDFEIDKLEKMLSKGKVVGDLIYIGKMDQK